jgi:hypothetical protein
VQSETARSPATAARRGLWREARPKLQTIKKTISHASHVTSIIRRCIGGAYRGQSGGVTMARAMVLNVTVAVAAFVPSSFTDGGDTVQLVVAGAPVQLQVTFWSNPCAGAAVTRKSACCPAIIVAVGGDADTL